MISSFLIRLNKSNQLSPRNSASTTTVLRYIQPSSQSIIMANQTLAMKPVLAESDNTITIATSKEWILPPKPRPGRKPTAESAPTKRKAQNRDAQRAFRERRAARVGELEQQIRDIEADHRAALATVEQEKGRLQMENIRLRETLEGMVKELNTIRSLTKLSQSPVHVTQNQYNQVQQTASPAPSEKASPVTYMLNESYIGQTVPLKRKRSTKRRRSSPELDIEAFKPPEACGFCSDGTPCLCAEAARDAARERHDPLVDANKLDSMTCGICTQQSPCFCKDVATAQKKETVRLDTLPTIDEDNGLCTGNPGSCRQCKTDPVSTLFCQSLASTASKPIRPALQKANSTFSTSSARDDPPTNTGDSYVPCSAAYKSLSRHANFGESDLGTLVAELKVDREKGVELTSVRDALRLLDRSFGRG